MAAAPVLGWNHLSRMIAAPAEVNGIRENGVIFVLQACASPKLMVESVFYSAIHQLLILKKAPKSRIEDAQTVPGIYDTCNHQLPANLPSLYWLLDLCWFNVQPYLG
jgi:hypothetical protein